MSLVLEFTLTVIAIDIGSCCVTERPGECPSSGEVGITIHECNNDMDCENPKKCCSVGGGAGQMCRNPVYSEFIEMCVSVIVCVCICICYFVACLLEVTFYSTCSFDFVVVSLSSSIGLFRPSQLHADDSGLCFCVCLTSFEH